MAVPPTKLGVTKETVVVVDPFTTTDTPVGASGTVNVVATTPVLDAPSPIAFVASTVNVYVTLGIRPVIGMLGALPVVVTVIPPELGVAVALNSVMAVPPTKLGAKKETMAVLSPVTATDTPVGASGTVNVVATTPVLDAPSPIAFVASTVNVYVTLGVRPVIGMLGALPVVVTVIPPELGVAVAV